MLTLDVILKHLNIEQESIVEDNNLCKIDIDSDDEYYYMELSEDRNTFLISILTLLSDSDISQKISELNEVRKELSLKLNTITQGYRKARRENIQKDLYNFDNELGKDAEKYILDYFSINVYKFYFDDVGLKYVEYEVDNEFKPTILLYHKNGKFCPIFNKNNVGIFRNSVSSLPSKLYNKYVNKKKATPTISTISDELLSIINSTSTSIIKNSESNEENEEKEEMSNEMNKKEMNIKLKGIRQMTLKELQGISIDLGININNGNKAKKKQELYDDIKKIIE